MGKAKTTVKKASAPMARSKPAATKKTAAAKSKGTSASKTTKLQPRNNKKRHQQATKTKNSGDSNDDSGEPNKASGGECEALTPKTRRKLIWVLLDCTFEREFLFDSTSLAPKDAVQRGGLRLVRTWELPDERAPQFVRLLPAKAKEVWMKAYINTRMTHGDCNLGDGECRHNWGIWSAFAPVVKAWEPTEEEAVKYMQEVEDDAADAYESFWGEPDRYPMDCLYNGDDNDYYMDGYNDEKAEDPFGACNHDDDSCMYSSDESE